MRKTLYDAKVSPAVLWLKWQVELVCLSLSKSWKDPQLSQIQNKFLCIIYWKLPGEEMFRESR